MAQAIGFDRERYISMQSEHIGERRRKIGGKLYLEMGGKLFDDMHASRVLPGFTPDNKIAMLERLRDELEIVVAVNANLLAKVRADLGISYQEDVLRLVDVFRERGFLVENVVLTQMEDDNTPAKTFKRRMERLGLKVAQHRRIEGYPGNTKLIVSYEGFGKNDYDVPVAALSRESQGDQGRVCKVRDIPHLEPSPRPSGQCGVRGGHGRP